MALQTAAFRETTNARGWVDSTFRSAYDLMLKPQTLGKLQYRYGPGLSLTFAKNLAGEVRPVRSKTITIFEQGAPTRPVLVSISTDAAPVYNTTVTFDTNSDAYMRQNFTIIIPAEYTDKDIDQEMVITGAAGSRKGAFMDVTASITTALSSVYVMVGASAFGYGSDGAEPMRKGAYSRTTTDRILKDAFGVEGGTIANEEWEEFNVEGGTFYVTKSTLEMDFRLDDQIDSALITGQANTNTTYLTDVSKTGETKAIPSAAGLESIMASLGQELTWDNTGFGVTKVRALRPLLENVGVVNMDLQLFAGSELVSSIEKNMVDEYLPTVAGGQSYWNTMGEIGFYVRAIDLDGVRMKIIKIHSLSNPNKYGLSSYKYKYGGYLMTEGQYNVNMMDGGAEENLRLPHLTLGYLAGNGENRQRIFMPEPGVHGIQGLPNVAVNSYDATMWHTLTHIVPIWTNMYKTIKINYNGDVGGGS